MISSLIIYNNFYSRISWLIFIYRQFTFNIKICMGLNRFKCSILLFSNNFIYFFWVKGIRVCNFFTILVKSTWYFYIFYFFSTHFFISWIHSYDFNFFNSWCNICIIYLHLKINCSIWSNLWIYWISSNCNRRCC